YFERQPARVGSNQILCSDARIDNREELCSHFNLHPARAKTLPDSFFILKAYEKWGEACPNYLLGDFTFVIWDAKAQSLFAARDHFGVRPLFYVHKAGTFAFANDLRALLSLPSVERKLNEQKIADLLVLLHADTVQTFYQDILRLPPAHTLTVGASGIRTKQYYVLEENINDIRFSSSEAYAEGLREKLTTAVNCRLRSHTSVGCELSGGLDSSSIACVAAIELQKKNKTLETFSSIPPHDYEGYHRPGWSFNEKPCIQSIAELYPNINPNFVVTSPDDQQLISSIEDTFYQQGTPTRAVFWEWIRALSLSARQKNCRVMLSGASGNTTISWDGKCLYSEMFFKRKWRHLLKAVIDTIKNRPLDTKKIAREILSTTLSDSLWSRLISRRIYPEPPWSAHSYINPSFASRLRLQERFHELGWDPFYRPLSNGRATRSRILLKGARCDAVDHVSAMRSVTHVERRDPTLDKRIVEYTLGIPETEYRQGFNSRLLIKRAMKNTVPEFVLQRRFRGVQALDFYPFYQECTEQLITYAQKLEQNDLVDEVISTQKLKKVIQELNSMEMQPLARLRAMQSLNRSFMIASFIHWEERANC
ncbi:MAG: asparagine synthase-related protein, partial [Pseudomonadales bacterium]|nr:asparagine synthase-related protein [Pseudomonadales bacterium]